MKKVPGPPGQTRASWGTGHGSVVQKVVVLRRKYRPKQTLKPEGALEVLKIVI